MRRADHRTLLLLLACSLGAACSDAGDEGGNGEGADELELWPVPSVGITGSTSRDAGMDAGRPRDGGSGATDSGAVIRDAKSELDSAASTLPDLSLQVFDPYEVYLLGTLAEGACYRDGLASVFDPNRVAVGFDCDAFASGGEIRPSDGRFVYIGSRGASDRPAVRMFTCDGCIPDAGVASYPAKPEENDELVTMCAADAGSIVESGMRVLPDSGVVQICGKSWVDELGRPVAPGYPRIFTFGHANTALRDDGVLELADAQVRPLANLDGGSFRAQRTRPDGYWVVPPAPEAGVAELWLIAFDGGAQRVGVYPALPPYQRDPRSAKLDGEGNLFEIMRDDRAAFRDTIVRRTLDGGSDVVYDEDTKPRLKIHISSLVSGP